MSTCWIVDQNPDIECEEGERYIVRCSYSLNPSHFSYFQECERAEQEAIALNSLNVPGPSLLEEMPWLKEA